MQFEERASQRLDEFEELVANAGATVETRLVFTHEGQTTIDRMIDEYDCLAALIPNASSPPDNVLVAIRGTVGVDRIVQVVSGLFANTCVAVTLLHVAGTDETTEDVKPLLDGIATRLSEEGIDNEAIDSRVTRHSSPLDAIVSLADEFDAVVMGESDPTLVTFVFGMPTRQVADRFLGPVVVVQREKPAR